MKSVAKAIASAVIAFGTGIVTAATDGGISNGEWWVILGGTLIAGATVWSVPNAESPWY